MSSVAPGGHSTPMVTGVGPWSCPLIRTRAPAGSQSIMMANPSNGSVCSPVTASFSSCTAGHGEYVISSGAATVVSIGFIANNCGTNSAAEPERKQSDALIEKVSEVRWRGSRPDGRMPTARRKSLAGPEIGSGGCASRGDTEDLFQARHALAGLLHAAERKRAGDHARPRVRGAACLTLPS